MHLRCFPFMTTDSKSSADCDLDAGFMSTGTARMFGRHLPCLIVVDCHPWPPKLYSIKQVPNIAFKGFCLVNAMGVFWSKACVLGGGWVQLANSLKKSSLTCRFRGIVSCRVTVAMSDPLPTLLRASSVRT